LARAILLNQHGALNSSADRHEDSCWAIRRQLRLEANKLGHCALYENELQRVWPLDEKNRKAKIEQFAKKHGFRLAYYSYGFCAIFEELPPSGE
jgi:hypothetical protein